MSNTEWMLLTLIVWNLMDTIRFARIESKLDMLLKGRRG